MGYRNLRWLDLSSSNLEKISAKAFKNQHLLLVLNISNTPIKYLSHDSLQPAKNLIILNVSNILSRNFNFDDTGFGHMTKLQTLTIRNTTWSPTYSSIIELNYNISETLHVDLSYNQMEVVSEWLFSKMIKITSLSLKVFNKF